MWRSLLLLNLKCPKFAIPQDGIQTFQVDASGTPLEYAGPCNGDPGQPGTYVTLTCLEN